MTKLSPDEDSETGWEGRKRLPPQWGVQRVTTFLVLLGVMLAGILIGHFGRGVGGSAPSSGPVGRGILLPPGPWGEMEYVPMVISAPVELLPVRKLEEAGSFWFFEGETRASLEEALRGVGATDNLCRELFADDRCETSPNGVALRPTAKAFFALGPKVRRDIYHRLFLASGNGTQLTFLPERGLAERFARSGVSEATVETLRRVAISSGSYLAFSGLPEVLNTIPDYNEKVRLMKALTEQRTCLLRLHVTPSSDLGALQRYWGKGSWKTDVSSILESLAHVQDGTWVDVVELLPPFPTSMLYTFPRQDNPLEGPPVRRDCHWTAFNFFREPPDPGYSDAAYVAQRLKLNYFPISGDPIYGDLVLFATPKGNIIHSAVFLAGDVVYTKNGDTTVHPWMLATIPDLLEQYSSVVEPSEKLSISFFRNKYD